MKAHRCQTLDPVHSSFCPEALVVLAATLPLSAVSIVEGTHRSHLRQGGPRACVRLQASVGLHAQAFAVRSVGTAMCQPKEPREETRPSRTGMLLNRIAPIFQICRQEYPYGAMLMLVLPCARGEDCSNKADQQL